MLSQISKLLPKPIDDQRHWDEALRILRRINPNLILAKLPWWKRIWVRVRLWLPHRFSDALLAQKPNEPEIFTGVALPLKGRNKESRAFEIQVRVLDYAIELRKALYRGQLQLSTMPEDPKSPKKPPDSGKAFVSGSTSEMDADITLRALMAQISDVPITSDAMDDIEADYWNKLATIAWEAAKYEREVKKGDPTLWLQRARRYIDIALERPNWTQEQRVSWTPAQLNLARITEMDGDQGKAIDILGRILGTEPLTPPQSVPEPRSSDTDAIIGLIKKMAIERDPKVLAGLIQSNYGLLPRSTIREITAALAGNLDGRFLDDLLRHLVSTSDA